MKHSPPCHSALTLSVAWLLAHVAAAYDGPKEKLHVYLAIGTSTMSGEAEAPDEARQVIDRCFVLNAKNQWEPATAPLNRYSTLLPDGTGPAAVGLGPAYGFALEMLDADPTISIGLVVNAGPGPDARMDRWGYKTTPYRNARGRTKVARRTGTLKGVIWHGAGAQTHTPNDTDLLKDLITSIRGDHGELDLPFIVGEVAGSTPINARLAALSADVHATDVASVEGLTMAGGRLETPGMIEFGKRYAEQMRRVQAKLAEEAKRRAAAPTRSPTIPIIDVHLHAHSVNGAGLDTLAAWMQKNGVSRVINSPLPQTLPKDGAEREQMLANYARYAGRIDRMCFFDLDEVETVEQAVAILKREVAAGAVAYGEHYGRSRMFDHPKCLMLYAACEQAGLPVMFHIDRDKNMDERGLPRVERVLKKFPKCTLVAHAFWWDQLPDGAVDRLLRNYPNLYADLSGLNVVTILNRDRRFAREFLIRHADRLMFGTDAGWWSFGKPSSERELQFELIEKLDLPDEVLAKIYHLNAERVYGLKPAPATPAQ